MNLRDLARPRAASDRRETSPTLPPPIRRKSNTWPDTPEGVMWVEIESEVLQDTIIWVAEKKYLKQTRAECPGKVVYFPPEIKELVETRDYIRSLPKTEDLTPSLLEFEDLLRAVHLVKKQLGGWVLPLAVANQMMAETPLPAIPVEEREPNKPTGKPRKRKPEQVTLVR